MRIELSSRNMLGNYRGSASTSQCEFQFARQLIFVENPQGENPEPYIHAAQAVVQSVWDDSPNAIAFAESWFRAAHPEFWEVWDRATAPEHPLTVYSISFHINDLHPSYDIARDPSYDFECIHHDAADLWQQEGVRGELPYFPDSDFVTVRRVNNQQFKLG